jgi:hypothetical protein
VAMGAWFVYFGAIIANLLLLIWWRRGCEWNYGDNKFPSRGHVLLGFVLSFIPVWSLIQFIIIAIWYIAVRCEGDVVLKKNKFNHYWFGVDYKEEKEN